MIRVERLCKRFQGRQLFAEVDLEFRKGETTVVLGPSGCGKSTLLRILNQLERQDEGMVAMEGLEIDPRLSAGEWRRRVHELRLRTGMVFQGFQLFPHLTVLQNVTLAPVTVKRMPMAAARERALALLGSVGMAGAADRYPARLSGGESQRVAIARTLAMDPEVLLLDEPTSALDPASTREVLEAIADVARRGFTLVLVSHNLELARRVADRVVVLQGGRVSFEGMGADLFAGGDGVREEVREFLDG